MKITGRIETDVVTDVKCDICTSSTHVEAGGLQFATLKAKWGFGTKHDGERYEFHLCERCFFRTIAYFRQERRVENLFDKTDQDSVTDDFGLVTRDDFFGDSESWR